jgi:mannose-6-phosphate isomerase-like protein (cupin superfamily)
MLKQSFKKVSLSFVLTFLSGFSLYAQSSINVDTVQIRESYENVLIKKLNSDKNASTFLIFIKKEVKLHKHRTHSETIIVLEGTGIMNLGDKRFEVKKGDVIFVPENTPHSVSVTSDIPLKVLSNQAPEFDGTDRVFVE